MHCELLVPGLFAARGGARLRSLELLLARGRRTEGDTLSLEDWLKEKFELAEDQGLPAGALTALALGLDPGERFWLRADPVHLRADRTQPRDRVAVMRGSLE